MCSENELGAILKVCDGYVKPQVIWPSQKQKKQSPNTSARGKQYTTQVTRLPHRGANKNKQRSSQSHTRAEEKPHPSTTTGGANPASQSDAGLGGYERVATALVCVPRSFSTPFIFQWREGSLLSRVRAKRAFRHATHR